eukprot:358188-Chlamydomonas_euryale.AAC.1
MPRRMPIKMPINSRGRLPKLQGVWQGCGNGAKAAPPQPSPKHRSCNYGDLAFLEWSLRVLGVVQDLS